MLPKPYKYKKPRKRKIDQGLNRIQRPSSAEELTGVILGKKASAPEERFARALYKKNLSFDFQVVVQTAYQIPGQLNTVDFVVFSGLPYPIEIDGDWVHKTSSKKEQDALRDAIINEKMVPRGWRPISRIPGHKVATQEDANNVVEEMF